jgi:flagellar hook-length control protein FliK
LTSPANGPPLTDPTPAQLVQAAANAVAATQAAAPLAASGAAASSTVASVGSGAAVSAAAQGATASAAPVGAGLAAGPTATGPTATGGSASATRNAGSATADSADNSSGVDRVRFVQRVARAFQTVGDQGGTLRLRLSPPDLGTVKLDVSVKNGSMSAQLETDTTEARDALVSNLPALRERLNELNIQVDRFEVNVAGQSPSGASGFSSSNAAYEQTGGQNSGGRSAARSSAGAAAGNDGAALAGAGAAVFSDSQLNVLV